MLQETGRIHKNGQMGSAAEIAVEPQMLQETERIHKNGQMGSVVESKLHLDYPQM
jgi:hypothetical protein